MESLITNTEEIFQQCPCRSQQVELLLKLFGKENEMCTNSFFINGNTGTGKSYVVKSILTCLKLQYSFISCIENFSSKLIYQKILRDAGVTDIKTCSTMMDFCRYIKQADIFKNSEKRFFIIFDKAERLRNMDAHLFPALLRLAELTSLNICVVFITEIIFEKFYTASGFYDPVKVHFADYNKAELLTIMCLDVPDDFTKDFYANYCNIIVSVFFGVCRDLNELRHLAILNFKKYCEPIHNENVDQNDVRKLWQSIGPHLRKAMQKVYLREVSSTQWESMQQSQIQTERVSAQVELPYFSKYLLLAAYFASYNPANTDRKFFAKKTAGRMSKRAKTSAKAATNVDKKFLGPKQFPYDRLMAIFYSIVEGGVNSSANILSQLSTLVTLNLITKHSADDSIDIPKYKCVVPLDFVISIGKQVDMDVMQYLHDTYLT